MASVDIAARFVERLVALLGEDGVERGEDERRFYAEDALRGRGSLGEDAALPLAVVRPKDGASTAKLLALASEAGVAVVAYGGGTGLMGGARSRRPGVVLDTSRLNQVDVRAADRFVWAGAGAVLADVDEALAPHNLCVGHDPWTYPVATVGGTLSTNGLGYRGGRYGGIGAQAVALEVALADGTLLRTRAVRRRSTGPDLARLFVGAEGTLGVITAACLEVFPTPERRELRAYNFERFEDGFAAIDAICGLGMRPSLLDYGEEHASDAGGREEEPPLLYLGFEGFSEEVEASLTRAEAIVLEHDGVALPQDVAQRFWGDRHVIAERFARNRREGRSNQRNPAVAFDYIHVALPPSQVLAFRERCHAEADAAGVGIIECGLWTAPDFFSAAFATAAADRGSERLRGLVDTLLQAAQDAGGSMEYVHGAGMRLAHLMQREHGSGLDLLRRLKAALDPAEILNPGKLGL
jgi:FAD/FMN-containing dehydrogenase